MSEHAAGQIHEIQVVREHSGIRYLLWLYADDGDSPNARGNVVRQDARRGAGLQTICRTNDTLRTLWVSPAGHLWTASTRGTVGTTARVSWPAARHAWLRFIPENGGPEWHTTSLPPIRTQGIAPSITALWGTDDEHVWAGAYDGHIYAWNGEAWAQVVDGPEGGGGAINAFGGSAASDVFSLGANGRILHFDGSTWASVRAPGPAPEGEGFTGLHVLDDGQVLITAAGPGPRGRLLRGNAAGLTELARCELAPRDILAVGAQLLMPAGGAGVATWSGGKVDIIKNNFDAVAGSTGAGRAYFIEAAQPQPSFIEFDPSEQHPWVRVTL
jgi:hypothetical protein